MLCATAFVAAQQQSFPGSVVDIAFQGLNFKRCN